MEQAEIYDFASTAIPAPDIERKTLNHCIAKKHVVQQKDDCHGFALMPTVMAWILGVLSSPNKNPIYSYMLLSICVVMKYHLFVQCLIYILHIFYQWTETAHLVKIIVLIKYRIYALLLSIKFDSSKLVKRYARIDLGNNFF